MSKTDDTDLTDFLKEMEVYRKEKIATLHEPRFSLSQVLEALEVEPALVRNWFDRGTLKLDADVFRVGRKHRRFSRFDLFRMAIAIEFSRQGIGPASAEAALAVLSDGLERELTAIASDLPPPELLFVDFSVEPPHVRRYLDDEGAPGVLVAIRLMAIIRRVSERVGEQVLYGTAKQIRAQIDDDEEPEA